MILLAMNIGNTRFSIGYKKDGNIDVANVLSASVMSGVDFIDIINRTMKDWGLMLENVNGVIISSVNPKLTDILIDSIKKIFNIVPVVVNADINMMLDLSIYDTKLIGSDRIAVCEAALIKHGAPAIVFDFGTSTTINVIDSLNRFLGGSILPGVMMGLNALSKNTAQLPYCENIVDAIDLIGRNTHECIISGAIYANAAIIDEMTDRIESYIGGKTVNIITGGNAEFILPYCRTKVIHEPALLFEGLFTLFDDNN